VIGARLNDAIREILVALTRPLPEPVDGFIFGAALIASDQVMRVFR